MSEGQLKKMHDEYRSTLTTERNKILKGLEPLYKKRDALVAEMQPIERKLRELQQQIKEKEAPLRSIGADLATIARAEGARTLTNDGPAATK